MGYHEDKVARNRAILEALHGIREEDPGPDPDAPVNFDGGVRETAPLPSDPEAEHNALVIEALRSLPTRGGGGEW